MSDDGEITITIDGVSAILLQKFAWNGRPIHYRIRHIDYVSVPRGAPPPPAGPGCQVALRQEQMQPPYPDDWYTLDCIAPPCPDSR